jgi:hypothetical protein
MMHFCDSRLVTARGSLFDTFRHYGNSISTDQNPHWHPCGFSNFEFVPEPALAVYVLSEPPSRNLAL